MGCNAKSLWNNIINQIYDIAYSNKKTNFIILCKNFHKIHNDLLEIFYTYINLNSKNHVKLIYIILTENYSFIPKDIINISLNIPVRKPTNNNFNKIKTNNIDNKSILNIKEYEYNDVTDYSKNILLSIIDYINNYNQLTFAELRNRLYNILTYNLNIYEIFNKILVSILKKNDLSNEKINRLLLTTNNFFKLYNNNYRPIFHMEKCIIDYINIVYDI